MTIALICLLFAGVLPYIAIVPAKMNKSYDNRDPRSSAAYQSGLSGRAVAAHQNALEAFPFFAAAIVTVAVFNPESTLLAPLAIAYTVLRISYVASYLADRPNLRSLLWTSAYAVNAGIFFLAIPYS